MTRSDMRQEDLERMFREWLAAEAAAVRTPPPELFARASAIPSASRRAWPSQPRLVSALAATAVMAVVLVLASLSLLDRFSTSANGVPATLVELDAAVGAAREALAQSAGVESEHQSYVRDHLASAIWADWRADGDQLVLQRVDRDVAEGGWWANPSAVPAATGRNVATTAWVQVDGVLYGATQDTHGEGQGWSVTAPPPGPLAFAIALITEGDYRPEVDAAQAEVRRSATTDGGSAWTLAITDAETRATHTWRIGADGVLTSFSFEDLSRAQSLDAEASPVTSARIEFRALSDPLPIHAPEVGSVLRLEDFDLPADFPLKP